MAQMPSLKRSAATSFLGVALALGVAACGSASPTEVLANYLEEVSNGDLEAACELVTEETREDCTEALNASGDLSDYTEGFVIGDDEKIRGDIAEVAIENPQGFNTSALLRKADDEWLIVYGVDTGVKP